MHIWDTGGSEKTKSFTQLYFRDSHAAILVYAIDNLDSFAQIDKWNEYLEEKGNNPNIVKILVGNKSDLRDRRKVPSSEGKKYAESKGMEFFETSAMVNDGMIHDLFNSLGNKIKQTFPKDLQGL